MSVCGKCHRDAPDGALFCSFCGEAIKPVTSPGQATDPLIGQTLAGKYFIHQLLGRGGMGDVYKATHLTLDRPVVLKLLKKLFHSDPSLVQRFHREARAASRLNHPNSITIIDFGQTDDGTLFMAMEYLGGQSLEHVIADEKSLPEPRVVHIGAQILAALAEAHALGIIHRDLKPANVMIESRRDEQDFVKVLDFGIAKLNEPGGSPGLTQAGIVCGTPGYMSTEQVRGEELDARSDIYAVGVILYEALTGVLPFQADTPMGLVTKHLVEDPPPLSVRRPGLVVSPALEAVIMRALARDRHDRFPSADDMRAALLACWPSVATPSIRPTPAPSGTMIFEPGAFPAAPAARPPTGSARPPSSPRSTPQAVQARMTEALVQAQSPRAAPVQKTPAPAQKTPALAQKTPALAQKTPAPAPPKASSPADRRVMYEEKAPPARSTGKFPMLAAAGVGAVLVLGIVGWFVTRGSSKPAGAAAASAASPVEQPKLDTPLPEPGAPAPAAPELGKAEAPDAEPPLGISIAPKAPAHRPEVKAAAEAPRTTKGVRLVRQQLNSIPTPPESSGDGVLMVLATPWAEVAIDGRSIGETPREVRLGGGTYRVRATHPALGTRERVVTIRAGKRQMWSPTFAN